LVGRFIDTEEKMTQPYVRTGALDRSPVLLLLCIISIWSTSCQKDPGFGGTGAIQGTITEKFYTDDYSLLIYEKQAVDEEVFIRFGDDPVLGDRMFTSQTGAFRFDYLYPGEYHIYYRSEDPSAIPEDDWAATLTVNLERGEVKDLGQLEKVTALDYDDGAAVIKGVVWEINYVNESRWPNLVIESEDYAHEQEVYLVYGDHDFYDERVRTQFDGYFEFSQLIPGDYLIFLYSEDVKRLTDQVVLKFEVTITELDQEVDLGTITIEKR
jgi:hypothetical protein